MNNLKYFFAFCLGWAFWQCEPATDDFKPSAGNADFSKFVSIGDSYTAGYTDGALSADGQQSSFPNIIAGQLETVGLTGGFKQPLIPEGKSIGSSGNSSYVLKVGESGLSPEAGIGNVELLSNPENWINSQAPFANVGVPGAKSFHLLTNKFGDYTLGAGNFNPFYTRFASNPGTSTVFNDAMSNSPTFVSLWIGGNDVLSYALAGGEATVGGVGTNDITDVTTFDYCISTMFSTLKNAGIEGVTANIPNISSLPYFTTVPYNALVISEEQAVALNAAYAGYNTTAQSNNWPTINFMTGPNGLVVEDKLGYLRHAVPSDLILLPALNGIKTEGWGSSVKIGKQYVLDATETASINSYTETFNEIIKSKAEENGLAFVDLNELLIEIVSTKTIDGVEYSSTFVSGNVFSLDGIHATPRGYAIIANEFIRAVNQKYGASVPLTNINDYRTNLFP
ncbi:MAG: hypothetical protein QM786_09480 [Breznakibacter sp.]